MQKEKNKNYTIKYAEWFWKEVDEITKFLSTNYYESTSYNFLDKLLTRIDYIEIFPYMYVEYKKNNKYRKRVVDNYILFYTIDRKNKIVYAVHIYDARKDSFNLN